MNQNLLEEDNKKEEEKENNARIKEDNGKQEGDEIWFGVTLIGRIIMTIYSLNGLFYLYNLLIQFIILVPALVYETDNALCHVIIWSLYFFFGIFTSNILIIPAYDFLLLPYLKFRNPFYHLESLFRVKYCIDNKNNNINMNDKSQKEKNKNNIEEKEKNKNKIYINVFLILIEVFYLVGLLLSSKIKDITKFIILVFYYFYY